MTQKSGNRSTIQSSHSTRGNLPKQYEISIRKSYLHVHDDGSSIYHSWDVESAICPSVDDWIKKRWYIYTMEYYSTKKSEIFFTKTDVTEYHTLHEISQSHRNKHHAFPAVWQYCRVQTCTGVKWPSCDGIIVFSLCSHGTILSLLLLVEHYG